VCSVIFSPKMMLVIWMPGPPYRMAVLSKKTAAERCVYIVFALHIFMDTSTDMGQNFLILVLVCPISDHSTDPDQQVNHNTDPKFGPRLWLKQVGLSLNAFYACIRKVSDSNFVQDTSCTQIFLSLQANAAIVTQTIPWPHTSRSFQINYSRPF
jgi:hypothetical protein